MLTGRLLTILANLALLVYSDYGGFQPRLSQDLPRFTQVDDHSLTNYLRRGGHPLSFQEKSIQCCDCGATFTFSAEEQEFFQSKGYTNEPKRCPSCRQARKAERYGGGYGDRSQRQMFPAVCAECGKETEVPFEPREGRPVYCSECYGKVRLNQ